MPAALVYEGSRLQFTPSTTNDNFTLDPGTTHVGYVLEVWWGGSITTSTGFETRVARSSGAAGAGTAGNVAKSNPLNGTQVIVFNTTYATTQPTLDAGDLWAEDWNPDGGVIRYHCAPNEEWVISGLAGSKTISCRNSVGTTASSMNAGASWGELA